MGDVVSLVEKAAEAISEEEVRKLEQKMLKNKYDFNDFLNQLQQLKKLGGMSRILDMIPGGKQLKDGTNIDDSMLRHAEAILCSMTPEERQNPEILGVMSRRTRIARGCGRPLVEIQQLLKRFDVMKGMMSKFKKMPVMTGDDDFGGSGSPVSGMSSVPSRALSQKAKKAKRKKHKGKRKKR